MNVACIQVNLKKSALATGLFSHSFVTKPQSAFKKVVGKPLEYLVPPEKATDQTPRAALYIPRTLKCVALPHLSNSDCQAAVLFLAHSTILIASVYLDINDELVPVWLDELVHYADGRHYYGILICMDSNAHSYSYGPTRNIRGDHLETFIFSANLTGENHSEIPTFQTPYAKSYIDVTLTKDVNIQQWRVSTVYNASDHNNIHFLIPLVTPVPPRTVRPWHTADWPTFTQLLQSNTYSIPDVITTDKLDKMVSHMYSRLKEALDKACPSTQVKIKFKGSAWFSDKLETLKRKVRRQYDRASKFDTDTEWHKYNILHKKFKYKCRKAKTGGWRHFVSETPNEHQMSRLARIAQHKDRVQVHSLQKPDGSFSQPGTDTLEELACHHFPTATTAPPRETSDPNRFVCRIDICTQYCSYVTPDLVEASLIKFKPLKAPGPDMIKPIVFRYLPASFLLFLTYIYKACLSLHYTPKLWQRAQVIFFPKPGKPNYIKAKNHRPIVLSRVSNALSPSAWNTCWKIIILFTVNSMGFLKAGVRKVLSVILSTISNSISFVGSHVLVSSSTSPRHMTPSTSNISGQRCTNMAETSILLNGTIIIFDIGASSLFYANFAKLFQNH